MKTSYSTPPASYFHRLVKPSNRPYVFMGDLNEALYEPIIQEKYGKVIRSTRKKEQFKIYDWENSDTKVELKSRNNDCAFYPDTMVGFNKVEEWGEDETDKRYFFLFGFLDGLYEWELTQENYDAIGGEDAVKAMKKKPSTTYSPYNENKLQLYIPIQKLIKISDIGCIVPDDLVCDSKRKTGCLIKFNCWN